MSIKLVCDVTMNLGGSIRPAIYLAKDLASRGYDVSVISPIMSNDVEHHLIANGITPVNLCTNFLTKNLDPSLLWFEAWAREAFLGSYSRHLGDELVVTINFSQMISVPSLICYLQGPPSVALKDMKKEFPINLRIVYNILSPIIEYFDEKLISQMIRGSPLIISNSKFCASMYSELGVKVDDVIYPPIECRTFHPSMSKPSSDYVLTYFGKETIFSIIKKIADSGVKIKAFGSKKPVHSRVLKHPNIEFRGTVTTSELVDLYSNALFTLFPFTHEPFGYVPLESMACGTPVLTYDVQGPSEYIVTDHTGWLTHTDAEMAQKAKELWTRGYPSRIRLNCVKKAINFDRKLYLEKWLKTLNNFPNLAESEKS